MTSSTQPLEELSDTALFDVFYEAGAHLIGTLNTERRAATTAADDARVEALTVEIRAIMDARREIDPKDRSAQIAFVNQWSARRSALRANPTT